MIFCKFLPHKGNLCWKVASKVIYTFYLKHQKYPFCAPIFHPLSETESYFNCVALVSNISSSHRVASRLGHLVTLQRRHFGGSDLLLLFVSYCGYSVKTIKASIYKIICPTNSKILFCTICLYKPKNVFFLG